MDKSQNLDVIIKLDDVKKIRLKRSINIYEKTLTRSNNRGCSLLFIDFVYYGSISKNTKFAYLGRQKSMAGYPKSQSFASTYLPGANLVALLK